MAANHYKRCAKNIKLLKDRNIKVVALSPHDSSKISIEAFSQAFPHAYKDINVGEPIIF